MASIKCGNCSGTHESVGDVRKCYAGQTVATVVREADKITERQLPFLAALLTERGLPTDGIGTLTKQQATERIGYLLSPKGKAEHPKISEQPKALEIRVASPARDGWQDYGSMAGSYTDPVPSPAPARQTWERFEDVPAGHYAVTSLTGSNDLDFFRVDRPTDGPYKGRYFVKRIIGGRPDVSVRGRTVLEAMKAIREADPAKAALRYGQEIGRCYRCNRHLTDETSRALGIGPDCRSQGF